MGSDIKKSGRHTNETVTVFYVLNATHEDKTYVMWCQMKALAILRRSIPLFKGSEKKFFSPYFPTYRDTRTHLKPKMSFCREVG